MANKKISEMIEATEIKNNDLIPIVQDGDNKKIKFSKILNTRNYKTGDTQTIPSWFGGGFVSNNIMSVYFTIPLPKGFDGLTWRITGGLISIRSVSGTYLKNSDTLADKNITNWSTTGNLLSIRINYTNALDTINNTPVGIDIRDLVISFS